jgi:ATP-dependent exoDNAse (exonuclease V) beta subunit
MQSIYRFRQAEVGIFIRMQDSGIGDLQLTPLRLAVNFRSTPEIVEWNNQQFSEIFPLTSDIATGAVEYSYSTANTTDQQQRDTHITLKGFLEGTADAQAHDVIHYIQETLANYPNEKIAILVRSRPHLTAIIPALKAADLRYNALEIDPLITRQCIQDCLALTRALIHPADRIAWLAVLRAPWCGLTLSDLLLLCQQNKSAMIWEQLQSSDARQAMSLDGQARIQRILPILEMAIKNRDRTGIRQWIENTWLALGGPATLSEYEEMADVTEFFELLAELTGHAQRINLEILNERITELRASTHHDDAPIQIMTVHSAKGLEFDTVILPHLEKANAKDDPSLLLWMDQPLQDDQTALLLAPLHAAGSKSDPLYTYIESLQKIKSRFEVDRLFYVAATRAKKRLHLVFSVKDKETAVTKGSFLAKLWPLIEKQISPETNTPDDHTAMSQQERRPHTINRLITNWKNPANIDLPTEHSSYQTKNGFQLYNHRPRIIGTVSHRIFQEISQQGLFWWQTQAPDRRSAFIKHQLTQAGISTNTVDDASAEVGSIIERALQDERGRWILEQHNNAKSEYQLTIQNKDGCENIIIDRTFIDADGVRWIIDYKTADNQQDNLELFMQKQLQQYAPQLEKYQQALKAIDSKPIKAGLYFPAIPAWCEC